ncbi:hypothetical protein BST81_06425 [Leptolyngbya sp. 'hensonii']|nr:hypothetical protein BST81_06425 [Leptolyngbya sp. 'hensonii']
MNLSLTLILAILFLILTGGSLLSEIVMLPLRDWFGWLHLFLSNWLGWVLLLLLLSWGLRE